MKFELKKTKLTNKVKLLKKKITSCLHLLIYLSKIRKYFVKIKIKKWYLKRNKYIKINDFLKYKKANIKLNNNFFFFTIIN